MSRMKHFPTLNEYTSWVVRQPAGAVLGTAFNGMQHPYEMYLSEYYGTNVTVIAGDCYEMDNRRYDLPAEWDGFTVGYHDSDLHDSYEGTQSGVEVTTEIEIAYLAELLGQDAVKAPAPQKAGVSLATIARKTVAAEKRAAKALHLIARATFKSTGATLYAIRSQDKTYHVTVCAGAVRCCVNAETGLNCEGRQYTGHCKHGDFAMAHEAEYGALEAKRQNEMDGARVVAPLVLGQAFEQDLQAHLEDEMPAQDDAFERVYRALVFGTTNTLDNIMQRAHLVEPDLATNALEVLRANGRIIVRKVERGVFWVDTPDQAYRSAYYGDYAA